MYLDYVIFFRGNYYIMAQVSNLFHHIPGSDRCQYDGQTISCHLFFRLCHTQNTIYQTHHEHVLELFLSTYYSIYSFLNILSILLLKHSVILQTSTVSISRCVFFHTYHYFLCRGVVCSLVNGVCQRMGSFHPSLQQTVYILFLASVVDVSPVLLHKNYINRRSVF